MTRAVRVLRRAQRDLQEIYVFLASEAPARADRVVDSLLDAVESLAEMADRGARPRDEILRAAGYRFLVVHGYLLFFKASARQVRVYRVLHAKRAYRGIL